MKILAIETSAKSVSAAVVEGGVPLASAYQNRGLTHSRTLMPGVGADPQRSWPCRVRLMTKKKSQEKLGKAS